MADVKETTETTGKKSETHYWDDAARWQGGQKWRALHHIDHVIPRCKGGTDEMDNLVTACRKCNLTKYAHSWTPIPLEALLGTSR